MTTGDQPPIETVQAYPVEQPMQPHHGAPILVLGIVSLLCSCFVAGIVAWVLANSDLREMDAGRMDPSGRGLTQAGKVCGIISVVLGIVAVITWTLLVVTGTYTGAKWF